MLFEMWKEKKILLPFPVNIYAIVLLFMRPFEYRTST